ncbi:MAG: agmatine deiminase family protein [Marinovum sp.]|nr:agmatine deiminase family protein [Marinovum sp.]
MAERHDMPIWPSYLVGEAGGIKHDDHGILTAHASCWDSNNRIPGLSRVALGERLERAYGAEHII